ATRRVDIWIMLGGSYQSGRQTTNSIPRVGAWLIAMLLCVAPTRAEILDYESKPPTVGEWKGQSPGTWVITKTVTHKDPSAPDETVFRREMLVGADSAGKPWFVVTKSTSEKGPWDSEFGHGGGTTWFDAPGTKVTPLPQQT